MPKILITGGAGFIGCFLARRLAARQDCQITLLDNLSRGKVDKDLQGILQNPNVQLIQADLTNPESFESAGGDYDYVYHLAALVGVKNALERPHQVLRLNLTSTVNLFEWAKGQRQLKRVLFSSTSEAYAGTLKHFGLPVPTSESVPIAIDDVRSSRTSYALSKLCGESIAFNYGRVCDVPVTVVRYHNVYGPRMGFLHVIPEMMVKMQHSSEIVVASPKHTRTFCYVEDAVEATVLCAEKEETADEILNIGNSRPEITIRDLAATVAVVIQKEVSLIDGEDTPGSPARRCPDISKLASLTGFTPQVALSEGIAKTYEWYRDKLNSRYE